MDSEFAEALRGSFAAKGPRASTSRSQLRHVEPLEKIAVVSVDQRPPRPEEEPDHLAVVPWFLADLATLP